MDDETPNTSRPTEFEGIGANKTATTTMEKGIQAQFDGVQDRERPRQQKRERARGSSRGRGGRGDRGGRHKKKEIGRAEWRYARNTFPSNHMH